MLFPLSVTTLYLSFSKRGWFNQAYHLEGGFKYNLLIQGILKSWMFVVVILLFGCIAGVRDQNIYVIGKLFSMWPLLRTLQYPDHGPVWGNGLNCHVLNNLRTPLSSVPPPTPLPHTSMNTLKPNFMLCLWHCRLMWSCSTLLPCWNLLEKSFVFDIDKATFDNISEK